MVFEFERFHLLIHKTYGTHFIQILLINGESIGFCIQN